MVGGSTGDGAEVGQGPCDGGRNQMWDLREVLAGGHRHCDPGVVVTIAFEGDEDDTMNFPPTSRGFGTSDIETYSPPPRWAAASTARGSARGRRRAAERRRRHGRDRTSQALPGLPAARPASAEGVSRAGRGHIRGRDVAARSAARSADARTAGGGDRRGPAARGPGAVVLSGSAV